MTGEPLEPPEVLEPAPLSVGGRKKRCCFLFGGGGVQRSFGGLFSGFLGFLGGFRARSGLSGSGCGKGGGRGGKVQGF